MIAALPMYDWPALRPATDAFWAAVAQRLRAEGIAAPAALSHPREACASWRHPDLLLGQACGMPYVSGLCGAARVIARPDYGLPDASRGLYRSVIVGRAGGGAGSLRALEGGRVAVNDWGSFSGHVALRAHLAGRRGGAAGPFFGGFVVTGSHRESARMVARGAADAAALDAVAWALLQAHEPATADRLAVLERTDPAPALPYITAPRFAALAPRLVAALDAAAAALAPVLGPLPGLPRRVSAAGDDDYAPIRVAARRAAREPFAPGAPALPPV